MLQTKLFFLAIFLLIISSSNGQVMLEKNKVIVAGKIEHATDRTLSIINLELVGPVQYNIKINEDGSFHKEFEVLSSHDSYIKYNNDLITVFLNPGDSLYLTADGENFKNRIQFSGKGARSNIVLHKFLDEFGRLAHAENFFKNMFNPDPVDAKQSFITFFNKVDEKIEMIKTEHQPDDQMVKWMQAYSKYRLAEELLQTGKRSKATLPDNFYDFIEANINDHEVSDFYCNQYYEDFLSEYYQYKVRMNERTYATPTTFFKIFSEQETGNTSAELHFTRTLNSLIRRGGYQHADSLLNEYADFVTNPSFKSYLRQAIIEKSKERKYTIDDLVALDFIGEIFSEIKEKHQGKVLYLDFWGTWCSPCLREFPASNALHAELINDDITFIYLCVSSKIEDWQKAIQKFELGGSHYLLNDNQYNTIAAEFNFTGVPIYMIIDKEGNIVNTYAGRPGDERTKAELLSIINK